VIRSTDPDYAKVIGSKQKSRFIGCQNLRGIKWYKIRAVWRK